MQTSDSPFQYLAVIPPAVPRGNIRSQEVTSERLARHVAVLFGVDVPENPAERTWVADYERLRVNEIARGALSGISGPTNDGDLDIIAMATLQKYGPDNKAALVLAGCEVLFKSVLPVFRDVLGIIGVSSDTKRVANVTLFAAWSLLVADMFRAQPALSAAAMKARAIQAKSYLEWGISPTDLNLAPSERPLEIRYSTDSPTSPRMLSVLDDVIPQSLSLLLWSQYGKDASNQRLVRSLVDNWCHYVLDSADQAVAWITPRSVGHSAETYFPLLEPVNAFVSDVLALSPHVQPLFKDACETGNPVPFQKSVGLDEHRHLTDRLLPRTYSAPEISTLAVRSQRALLMTHMTILRVFHNGDDFRSSYLEAECRKDAKQIVQIAKHLWGEADPLTVILNMSSAAMELADLRDTLDPASMRIAQNVLIDGYATIYAAWHSGIVHDGVWIGLVNEHSAELRQAIEHIEKRDRQQAQTLRETHWNYWRSVTKETGLSGDWRRAFSDLESADPLPATGMNVLFHNYLALPFRSDDRQEVMEALKFSSNKLIPLRKRVMASRMSERPYRVSLQTTARPVHDLLMQRQLTAKDEAWLFATAAKLETQLREETALGRHFFDGTPRAPRDLNQSDLNFLGSLLRVQVSLLERGFNPSPKFDLTLERAANTIDVAWQTYSQLLAQEAKQAGAAVSGPPDTRQFAEFRDYERRVKTVAESSAPTVSEQTIESVNESLHRSKVSREAMEPESGSSINV